MQNQCALLTLLVTVAAAPVGGQTVTLDNATIEARVQAVIEQAMQRPEAVGLSVAVARGDELLVERGVGTADLEFAVPANAETSFRIGSVTKQFTAAAIMKLVERGRVSLDDDIGKFLPDFDTGGRAITIRELLNHTSGIPSYTSQPDFFKKGSPVDLSHEELLAFIDGVPFDFEPGKGWNYSNTGYYLLGMVIEAVDGRSYASFVQQELFSPLGLTRTRYGSERDIIPNRAQGYQVNPANGTRVNDALISMRTPGAAGALISTAGDLVRWQIALVNGRAVSPESYEQMITSTVATGQGNARYGFGLQVVEVNGQRRITHSGGIPGFNSVLTWLPDEKLHVAVISNSEALPSEAIGNNIIAAITSAEPPPPPRTKGGADSEAAVRRLIEEIARGEPNYELLSPQLAQATRQQLPVMQPMFEQLGAIESISFVSVGPNGADIYDVELANGSVTFMIVVDDDGIVLGAGVRPATPANQP